MSQFAKEDPVTDPPMLTAEEDPLMRALKRMENAIESQRSGAAPANLPVGEIVESNPPPAPERAAVASASEPASEPAASAPASKTASEPAAPAPAPASEPAAPVPVPEMQTQEKTAPQIVEAPVRTKEAQDASIEEEVIPFLEMDGASVAPASLPRRKSRADVVSMEIERHDEEELMALGATDTPGSSSKRRKQSHRNKKQPSLAGTLIAVFAVQGFLLTGFIAAIALSDGFRGLVKESVVKLLSPEGQEKGSVSRPYEPIGGSIPLNPPLDDSASLREISLLSSEIKDIKRQLEAGPLDAKAELDLLSERNQLTSFADAAITRGDRGAFVKLQDLAKSSANEELRQGAEAELLRVKFFYASGTRYGTYNLPMTQLYPELKSKAEEDLTIDQKVRLLLDENQDWRVRTRAAYLLGSQRFESKAALALIHAIQTDGSLDVLKECIYSFEEVTEKYRSPGLFEIDHLLTWWEANKKEFTGG